MIKKLDFIDRNNGFLDINTYLIEEFQTLNLKSLKSIKAITVEKYDCYCIKIRDEKYLFKPCIKEQVIKELLASKMLDKVGYNHVEYDAACVLGEYGVISKYYKKDENEYISGDTLINSYCDFIDDKVDKNNLNYNKYNNLESIWNMLEIKYKYRPNKEAIIKNIMERLVEKFMFDILIAQDDGASYNWEIEENDNGAALVPIYDNGCMLDILDPTLDIEEIRNIKVDDDSSSLSSYSNLTELKKFLHYSSDSFKTGFEFLLKHLTPNDIKWMLVDIASETRIEIDPKIKNNIITRYTINYKELQSILEEELNKKR